ncbi:DUF4012 domain-containing protein [Bifidobacterium felsineum]|nr:DUF4012 domain-containing protein [Bifidobacterium felsineum]MBT1165097.1 DUF4012 domain-containing protein [Bifidobacterium felsineum]
MPSHARVIQKKSHVVRNTCLIIVALLLVMVGAAGIVGFQFYQSAMRAKTHLNNVISQAKVISSGSTDEMVKSLSDVSYIQQETAAAKQEVSGPLWGFAEKLPQVGGDVATVRTTIDTLDDFAQTTLPALSKTVTGLSDANLSSGDGQLNMEPIIAAAKQMSTVNQSMQKQAKTIESLPEPKIPMVKNALDQGRDKMSTMAQATESLSGLLNMMPNFLGANGARNYVLLAQTNSEIRGSGGLVGSAGSVSADNGKITVGTFYADAEFPTNVAASDANEQGDSTLYNGLYLGQYVHNVSSTPDFPRVATMAQKFWKAASFGGDSDGVMSLDPVALQALIGATGDVTLSDGRVLNGSNTAEFLLSTVYKDLAVSEQDKYFSETAAQTVDHLFSDMNTQKLMTVAKTMMTMAQQRHLYFWSFHDEDLAALRSAGLTGEITNDAQNPVTGVYLNQMQASKMDWYIKRNSTVKKTGDNTYHVSYTLTNTLKASQASSLPEYVTANAKNGVALDRVMLYTPAGGEISNIASSNGSKFTAVQAPNHMAYMADLSIAPEVSITVEYDVTTTQGAANLKLDQTPTTGDPAITYQY